MDDAFGYWLSGFVDGEGTFSIIKTNGAGYTCRFGIVLRSDDWLTLKRICETTGLGRVTHNRKTYGNSNPQSVWTVHRKSETLELTSIFDKYPLQARKRMDYAVWREAVLLWNSDTRDWERMSNLAAKIRGVRAYSELMALV